jgi:peptide deformylase
MILTGKQLSTEPAELVKTPEEAEEIIKRLEWELSNSPISGIGLSGPQVDINKAAAIVRMGRYSVNLVNPVLVEANGLVIFEEGCLSFPGEQATTIRFEEIVVEMIDDYGPSLSSGVRRVAFGGSVDGNLNKVAELLCVCVQHEISHLYSMTMHDFKPEEIGRNDQCPCRSGKKNKKCCGHKLYNRNLDKLFINSYRSE